MGERWSYFVERRRGCRNGRWNPSLLGLEGRRHWSRDSGETALRVEGIGSGGGKRWWSAEDGGGRTEVVEMRWRCVGDGWREKSRQCCWFHHSPHLLPWRVPLMELRLILWNDAVSVSQTLSYSANVWSDLFLRLCLQSERRCPRWGLHLATYGLNGVVFLCSIPKRAANYVVLCPAILLMLVAHSPAHGQRLAWTSKYKDI